MEGRKNQFDKKYFRGTLSVEYSIGTSQLKAFIKTEPPITVKTGDDSEIKTSKIEIIASSPCFCLHGELRVDIEFEREGAKQTLLYLPEPNKDHAYENISRLKEDYERMINRVIESHKNKVPFDIREN